MESFDAITASNSAGGSQIPEIEEYDALPRLNEALWEGWEFDKLNNQSRIGETKNWFEVNPSPWVGVLGKTLGNLFATVMYGTQEQRFRTSAEKEQLVPLYSYAVGIFDFEPPANLRKFVQVRGAVELYGYFIRSLEAEKSRLKDDTEDDTSEDAEREILLQKVEDNLSDMIFHIFKAIASLRE